MYTVYKLSICVCIYDKKLCPFFLYVDLAGCAFSYIYMFRALYAFMFDFRKREIYDIHILNRSLTMFETMNILINNILIKFYAYHAYMFLFLFWIWWAHIRPHTHTNTTLETNMYTHKHRYKFKMSGLGYLSKSFYKNVYIHYTRFSSVLMLHA